MNWLNWVPQGWADLGAIAVIVALLYAYWQVKYAKNQMEEASRARRLQATRELLNEIGTEELRELRGWLLDEMGPSDLKSAQDHAKARRVAVAYDRVGYMVKQRLIPDEALFEFQQDEIQLLWRKLYPIIEEVRKNRKRPSYCISFQWLAEVWLPRMWSSRRK